MVAQKPQFMCQDAYDKIIADSIPTQLKNELIEACASCDCESGGANINSVEHCYDNFCKQQKLSGKTVRLNQNEIVGHVKNLNSLTSYLQDELNQNAEQLKERFRHLAGKGSEREQKEAKEWLDETLQDYDLKISGAPCWIFRDETSDVNCLYSSSLDCLPWRLGLPALLGKTNSNTLKIEFIGYCISGNAVVGCKEPTCIDAGYYFTKHIWKPGGKTQPISHASCSCSNQGGVMEIVASPPALKDITDNIYILGGLT